MPTTLIIVEQPITKPDLDFILGLHADNTEDGLDAENYAVAVPVGHESGKFVQVLDDLALADFSEASRDSKEEPEDQAVSDARAVLDSTVASFTAAEQRATGDLLRGDLLTALKDVVERRSVDEIVVLTLPHFVEEALRRDLASRVRKATGLPTLKLMAHVKLGE
jgi:hypothetical protein